jgi:hypothetical protein
MRANTTPFFRKKTCAHKWITNYLHSIKNESYSDSLKTFIVLSSHPATGGLHISPDIPEIDQSK